MLSNRLAVALVGGACMLAAGAGAFVATRQSQPAPTVTGAPAASTSVTPPNNVVQETEAVMEPAPAPPAAQPVAEPAAPAVWSEPTPRQTVRKRAIRPAPRRSTPTTTSARREAPRAEAPAPAVPETEPVSVDEEAATSQSPRRIESPEPPAPAAPAFEEITVAADRVIGLEIENTISSETAQVEDQVEAKVSRNVMADGRVAIPAGTRVLGNVTAVERGGKVKERARLAVRFHTLVLADGTTVAVQSDTVYRDGESPSRASTAKIGGGAVGGAILGAILGGTKGAIIGGSAGAAGGTAATMAGSRRPATLPAGSTVTVRVLSPVTVNVER